MDYKLFKLKTRTINMWTSHTTSHHRCLSHKLHNTKTTSAPFLPLEMEDDYLKLFVEETSFSNNIVLGFFLPESWWAPLPHFFQGWIRNYIGCTLLYLITGSLWCFYLYYWKRNFYLPEDAIPSNKAMLTQIYVTMKAIPWFTLYPTVSEYMIEHGWTKSFPRISDVGWSMYVVYTIIYLIIVEFGMYWVHRWTHEIKSLYYFHSTHHVYNKQNTISPFAGLAFDPLDGIIQALPHVIANFLAPMHFTTHVAFMFIDGIWTTNIHDSINGKVWPLMGGGYHVIHHTTYRHNYGHFFIWMDWMFGTLHYPLEDEPKKL